MGEGSKFEGGLPRGLSFSAGIDALFCFCLSSGREGERIVCEGRGREKNTYNARSEKEHAYTMSYK